MQHVNNWEIISVDMNCGPTLLPSQKMTFDKSYRYLFNSEHLFVHPQRKNEKREQNVVNSDLTIPLRRPRPTQTL